jgi:hypothetical protein
MGKGLRWNNVVYPRGNQIRIHDSAASSAGFVTRLGILCLGARISGSPLMTCDQNWRSGHRAVVTRKLQD